MCIRHLQRISASLLLLCLFGYSAQGYYHHPVVLDENRHDDEFFTFVTRPDIYAPRWDIEVYNEAAVTPGYWFVAPYEEAIQSDSSPPWNAPHIYDSNGDLIWSGAPVFNGYTTFDFRVIDILGKPMLSAIAPHEGKALIFDDTYHVHKEVPLGPQSLAMDEISLNVHEFMTVENGTRVLYLTREPKLTSRKNSKAVGFNGNCYAGFDGFRELDVETWEVIFKWSSESNIGLDESVVDQSPVEQRCSQKGGPWEFFHANSIDKFPDGDYLVSGRRTYAVYKISSADGSIVWRLGGRKSDFKMPFEFSGQHSAKVQGFNATHTIISLFDNAFGPGHPRTTHEFSRGMLLALDTTAMTAKMIAEYPHPDGGYATSRGNMQVLPNEHVWLCWMERSLQSEHAANGSILMKAGFKPNIASYRSWKLPWIGRPTDPPDVHASAIVKDDVFYTIVHMSWNGATEVKEWHVYHASGQDGRNRTLVATTPRFGFETVVWTTGQANYVLAEAIGKDGHKLGESYVFPTIPTKDNLNSGGFNRAGSKSSSSNSTNPRSAFWLRTAIRNPLVTFLCGIFVVLFAISIVRGTQDFMNRESTVLRQRSKSAYDGLYDLDIQDAEAENERPSVELEPIGSPSKPLLGSYE